MDDYTRWLNAAPGSAEETLFSGLYQELKRIAAGKMANERRRGGTLGATALVHEAWLRLQDSTPEPWRDRKQFYAASSEAMRRILVEAARRRLAAKRGGGQANQNLDDHEPASPIADERLLGIHEALAELEKENDLHARIVKLRYFAGMNHQEIASLLGVHEKTIQRHWQVAKVWLYRALKK